MKLLQCSKINNFNTIYKEGFLFQPDDMNILDKEFKSPLWYAIENKNLDFAKWLISLGADVN